MIPSVKTLLQIPGLARKDAILLRRVLDGRASPLDVDPMIGLLRSGAPSSFGWEAKMLAANKLLDMHGVEWCSYECSRYDLSPKGFDFVNAGDTYNTTLLHIPGKGFRVGCWGDLVEAHERRCVKCRKMWGGES